MATAQTSPAAAMPPPPPIPVATARAVATPQGGAAQALVPVPPTLQNAIPDEDLELLRVAHLSVELDVTIPIQEFRVRHLLALEPGTVIPSQWSYGEDVPLSAGRVQLARSEFEVVDDQLAVRITRLP